MAPTPSDAELAEAILASAERGEHPDSDEIASAELPSTALPVLLDALERAREEVKSEIRTLSRTSAPDLSGWIEQAARLQADLERSRADARAIVAEAEAGSALSAAVDDSASKVALLEGEMAFNDTLSGTLERVRDIEAQLDQARDSAAIRQDGFVEALEQLEAADEGLRALEKQQGLEDARVVGLLRGRLEELKKGVEESALECWNALLVVDAEERKAVLRHEIQRQTTVSIHAVVEALSRLQALNGPVERLAKDFGAVILSPRLHLAPDRTFATLEISGNTIQVSSRSATTSAEGAIEDVSHFVEYLNSWLPSSISKPVFGKLARSIAGLLTVVWVEPTMPMAADESVHEFEHVMERLVALAEFLGELEWDGRDEIMAWVQRAPITWLQRRKEKALANVRVLCVQGMREKHVVERVETEVVSKNDVIMEGNAPAAAEDDDWNEDWNEDEETAEHDRKPVAEEASEVEDDTDASAWGLDDNLNEPVAENGRSSNGSDSGEDEENEEDEEEDAWGWGDDENENKTPSPISTRKQAPQASRTNGDSGRPKSSAEQEVTLRENYTVTAVPDAIVEAISHIVSDAEKLASSSLSSSQLASAGAGLYSLPTLMLAMYRATATVCYANDPAGNMLLYNDCFRLTDRLRTFIADLKSRNSGGTSNSAVTRLRLDADLTALDGFGRRAYAREMESQRTILRDLLDGAQGFANCTTAPFAGACEDAVRATTDRIRDLRVQWRDVLSHSARMQALGALLEAAVGKVVADIEDLPDISDDESRQLKRLCDELAEVRDVFVPDDEAEQGQRPETQNVAVVWTPSWFKLQYLGEVLESSLADIKYMWADSELQLEFDADELTDLIRALFAESEHRRKAIAEIRRTARRRG